MKVPWTETTLSTIFSKYQLKDLFNTDEFELFSQRLPDKTFNLGSEKCSGSKKSKIRFSKKYLQLTNQFLHVALKTPKAFSTATGNNNRAGQREHFLRERSII